MRYKINRNVVFQKLDKKLVGFDVDRSFLYTFNDTAEYIYKKIKGGFGEKEIAKLLTQKFDVDFKIAIKDVLVIIGELKKNKILY